MSKIRCFIGDHKIYGDFDHKIYGDFVETLLGTLWGDFTNHKTFKNFL